MGAKVKIIHRGSRVGKHAPPISRSGGFIPYSKKISKNLINSDKNILLGMDGDLFSS